MSNRSTPTHWKRRPSIRRSMGQAVPRRRRLLSMRRSRVPLAGALLAVCATFLAGCGSSTSGNVDVVLVDRSKSFCQAQPDCLGRIDSYVDDNVAGLSKQGGTLRLF